MKNEIFKVLIKRVLTSLLVLFFLMSLLFLLIRIAPGDPSLKFMSPLLSPKLAALVKKSFSLEGPLPEQFRIFILNLCRGEFGISYIYRVPVIQVIMQYLPFTIAFSLISFTIQILAGFSFSLLAFKKANRFTDKFLSGSSIAVYALPSFVTGVILVYIFSGKLNLLPSSGLSSLDNDSYDFISRITDYSLHLILPLITLSLNGIAVFYKYLRDNLESVYNKPFVENLRANGYTEKEIIRKHIIPNAVNPLISVAGVELGLLFGGALITEVIFSLPGMGRLTVNAILSRDYPLITGCTFMAGLLVISTNLCADIIKALLDKRIAKGILN